MSTKMSLYEYPGSEVVRICLRLERMLENINCLRKIKEDYADKMIIEYLLQIIDVVERSDMRNKLIRFFSKYIASVLGFSGSSKVDNEFLEDFIKDLEHTVDDLYSCGNLIDLYIRENRFFISLRRQVNAGSGLLCESKSPDLWSWLKTSKYRRSGDIDFWMSGFSFLQKIVNKLLFLLRDSRRMISYSANDGFYQYEYNKSNKVLHLVRIAIDSDLAIYPKITINNKRVLVYFNILQDVHSTEQAGISRYEKFIRFDLACCVL